MALDRGPAAAVEFRAEKAAAAEEEKTTPPCTCSNRREEPGKFTGE